MDLPISSRNDWFKCSILDNGALSFNAFNCSHTWTAPTYPCDMTLDFSTNTTFSEPVATSVSRTFDKTQCPDASKVGADAKSLNPAVSIDAPVSVAVPVSVPISDITGVISDIYPISR